MNSWLRLVLFLLPVLGGAQDLHYSQFYLQPMSLCPAATGQMPGDLRLTARYRSQWKQVPVDYATYAAAVEWKPKEKGKWRFGAQLQQDRAGDGRLTWLEGGVSAALNQPVGRNQRLAAGFGAALVQRSVRLGNLSFKNQWNGLIYDPGLPSKEPLEGTTGIAPSFSAGLLWHGAKQVAGPEATAGIGWFHLNQPIVSLGDFDIRLKSRISFFGNVKFPINERLDGLMLTEWQSMGAAKEIVFGGGMRFQMAQGPGNDRFFQVSLVHRVHDALIPAIQWEYNEWTIGMSYDWNISAFDRATQNRGGIEIAVIWQRIPVPEITTVKNCPVF